MRQDYDSQALKAHELEKIIKESGLRPGNEVNFLNVGFSQFESPFEERTAVYATRKSASVFMALEETGSAQLKGR